MPSSKNLPPTNAILGAKFYTGKGHNVDAQVATRGEFFKALLRCIEQTSVMRGDGDSKTVALDAALAEFKKVLKAAHKRGGRAIFIGNGGSAAIASHMAVDYTKNGGIRAVAFNDAPTLTCLANDFGYDRVFAKQIEYHARAEDVVVIVSTSGRSPNIVAAADEARERGLRGVFTFSGMNPNNALRTRGDLNFYVPCDDYGLVELSHLALLHSVVSV